MGNVSLIGISHSIAPYNKRRISKIKTTMKEYIPTPVDTQSIQIPEELKSLAEEMSKNVHEVWAQTRISQGWTYGEERNDAEKKHPCLVPYEELSEEEKEYDRNTSVETIKLILKLGFKITKV